MTCIAAETSFAINENENYKKYEGPKCNFNVCAINENENYKKI